MWLSIQTLMASWILLLWGIHSERRKIPFRRILSLPIFGSFGSREATIFSTTLWTLQTPLNLSYMLSFLQLYFSVNVFPLSGITASIFFWPSERFYVILSTWGELLPLKTRLQLFVFQKTSWNNLVLRKQKRDAFFLERKKRDALLKCTREKNAPQIWNGN